MARAILSICGMFPVESLATLFDNVKDFNGVRNRYRQIPVTDFVDFIVLKAPRLFVGIPVFSNA